MAIFSPISLSKHIEGLGFVVVFKTNTIKLQADTQLNKHLENAYLLLPWQLLQIQVAFLECLMFASLGLKQMTHFGHYHNQTEISKHRIDGIACIC